MKPEFHEEWFGWDSCRVLARLARKVAPLEGRIIEIGCWEGKSTCALANAVYPATVEAVDTWEGSPGEISGELAVGRDVFAQFETNVAAFTRGNVVAHRGDWRDYLAKDRTIVRFLHIDAEHTYREVRDTIEAALDLVVPGGIICGDDNHHLPVISAAVDVLGPVESEVTLWYWEAPRGDT